MLHFVRIRSIDFLSGGLSRFLRDASSLTIGTLIAQVVFVGAIPLLTRLYDPAQFGAYAVFGALTTVLVVFATGRLELAITLPESIRDARAVALLGLGFSGVFSLLLLGLVFVLIELKSGMLRSQGLLPWVFLLPVSVFAAAVFQTVQLWNNRICAYRQMGKNQVVQAICVNGLGVTFGLSELDGGLILGIGLGSVLSSTQAFIAALIGTSGLYGHVTLQSVVRMLRRYRAQVTHVAPAQLLGIFAGHLPILLISSQYSISAAGHFSLASRVVGLPALLIANPCGDVYRQRISEQWNTNGRFDESFDGVFFLLLLLAVPCFGLLLLLSPHLFPLVLGENWADAGSLAQLLTVGAFFHFILTPLDKGAVVVGAKRYIVFWQALRLFLFTVIALWAIFLGPPLFHLVLWLTVSGIILNLIDGYYEREFSRGRI